MTVTLELPPETERKLTELAARSGKDVSGFLCQLIEREAQTVNGAGRAEPAIQAAAPPWERLDEILAPFRREVEESGMTDDELRDFFTEVRDEVRAEKRAKRTQGKTTG